MEVTTIGLDIAKSVFQVHGADANGNVIVRCQIKRRYVLAFFQKLAPCLVSVEACASLHHWSRELKALGLARSQFMSASAFGQRYSPSE
jgi:transposase